MSTNHEFQIHRFNALTCEQLYAILQLRNEVFVVEQNCVYQDMDGYDQQSLHVVGNEKDELIAYCRILPAQLKYEEWSIGRVVVKASARGKKIAHQLMVFALNAIEERQGAAVRLSAQSYLLNFYGSLGFESVGKSYLEDGIPHTEMLRTLI